MSFGKMQEIVQKSGKSRENGIKKNSKVLIYSTLECTQVPRLGRKLMNTIERYLNINRL